MTYINHSILLFCTFTHRYSFIYFPTFLFFKLKFSHTALLCFVISTISNSMTTLANYNRLKCTQLQHVQKSETYWFLLKDFGNPLALTGSVIYKKLTSKWWLFYIYIYIYIACRHNHTSQLPDSIYYVCM